MARYDKYDPVSGGFRAPIGFAPVAGDRGVPFAVGLDANGRVVKGAGTSGVVGVLIVTKLHAIGDIVDVMTGGEIVEAGGGAAGTTVLAAGIPIHGVLATGLVQAAGGVGTKQIGFTVEGGSLANTRFVVRAARTLEA